MRNYEVGATYKIHYWGKKFTVLAIDGTQVTGKWEDGRVTTHSTPLDKSDVKIA